MLSSPYAARDCEQNTFFFGKPRTNNFLFVCQGLEKNIQRSLRKTANY